MKYHYFASYLYNQNFGFGIANCEVIRDTEVTSMRDICEIAAMIQDHEGYSELPTILNYQLLVKEIQ